MDSAGGISDMQWLYAYLCVYVCIYICVCICVCIYIYAHICNNKEAICLRRERGDMGKVGGKK